MKILYITQTLPYPLYSGGHIKTYSTLKFLKGKKHDITLCAFVTKKKNLKYKHELEKLGIRIGPLLLNHYITEDIGRLRKIIIFLESLFLIKPFTIYKYYNSEFKKQIIRILNRDKFDCIWIDQLNMAQYLPESFKGFTVLELQNVDSLFFKRMTLIDSSIVLSLFALSEWVKYSIYERIYFPKFQKIYAISNFDKMQIKKITRGNDIEVLFPKIPANKISEYKRLEKTLLFIGSLKWYPNRDGIKWFLSKVYPEIQKRIPDIKFWIVGEIQKDFQRANLKGVKFWGFQKNVDKFYQKASLFIVPIRYGSGTRLKILEALSYNLPIISTSQGMEGLYEHCLNKIQIANEGRDFIEKISDHFG